MKTNNHNHTPEHEHEFNGTILSILFMILFIIFLMFIVVMNALYWNPPTIDEAKNQLEEELKYITSEVVFSSQVAVVNPFTQVISKVDFKESTGPDRKTFLSDKRAQREETRSSVCLSFNSVVNGKETVDSVDPRSFTELEKQDIALQISGVVQSPERFFNELDTLVNSKKIDGVLEVCSGIKSTYLIAELGKQELKIYNVVSSYKDLKLELVTTLPIINFEYKFIPDYLEGLPFISSGFGEDGFSVWNYYILDTAVNDKTLIESCETKYDLQVSEKEGILTCKREYRPE